MPRDGQPGSSGSSERPDEVSPTGADDLAPTMKGWRRVGSDIKSGSKSIFKKLVRPFTHGLAVDIHDAVEEDLR